MIFKFLKAQNGDCTLIKYTDNSGAQRNIIIDSGLDATYFDLATNTFGELKAEIDDIKAHDQRIDLLILTHIDNDHICGFLKLFEMDEQIPGIINMVWFNSGKLIAEKIEIEANKALAIKMQQQGVVATGVSEGIDFEDFLLKYDFWARDLILGGQRHVIHDAQFEILGPTIAQLHKLLKEYQDKTEDDAYTSAGTNDWRTDVESFIQEEVSNYNFSQDTSVKNGSSISFILTLKGKKFVFLGDSHPRPITKALAELGHTAKKPLAVEFLKVSHHGSKANTNKKLLSTLDTEHYIISTNSQVYGHPHKRTLSRIIARNPNAIFHFNYENVRENIFSEADRGKYNIRARLTPSIFYKI
ncbi:Zn-dependent hydrolase [Chitinophaga parva]|uniref:Zn-dependent hydrolase n=1 Tax=Chitinophaga parva TaxID=2169414 RepID=A0A2T7BIM6_9BACT|nr:MBL fold metallo-hydrolase [Chitinophaga parva]PUZ26124.1 Zn-dependent hydrolase [Chitinophaga parva]